MYYEENKIAPYSSSDVGAINTKTKLDLTKLFCSWNFTAPLFDSKVNRRNNQYKYNRQTTDFYR